MGIGTRWEGAGIFTLGVADSEQYFGLGGARDAFAFGYNGAAFGIVRLRHGIREVYTLTVTGAATGAGNAIVTLDGTAVNVPVTNAAGLIQRTVYELAAGSYGAAGALGGWDAYGLGATVLFVARLPRTSAAAFTFDANGTGATANFAQSVIGAPPTYYWTPQTTWGEDRMNGAGGLLNPSGHDLDPTKLNVYGISFQYLGAGEIRFFCSTTQSGALLCVHRIKYDGTSTELSVINPNLQIFARARNVGNTSSVAVLSGSARGFSEGDTQDAQTLTWTAEGSKSTISTTETPLLTLRNEAVVNGVVNKAIIRLTGLSHYANGTGTNPVTVRIRRGMIVGATGTAPSFASVSADSCASTDTAATAATGGTLLFSRKVGRNIGDVVDLTKMDFVLTPGETCTVTSVTTATNYDAECSLRWREEF